MRSSSVQEVLPVSSDFIFDFDGNNEEHHENVNRGFENLNERSHL